MGSFLEKYNDPKKLDPFARANSVRACSDGPPPPPPLTEWTRLRGIPRR